MVWELALPAEIGAETRREITAAFARALVARYRVAVDVAIHAPHRKCDDRNHHAHVITTRAMSADGLGKKARVFDAAQTGGPEIEAMRGAGLAAMRAALEKQRESPEAGDSVRDRLRRMLGREQERSGAGPKGPEPGDVRARLDAALGRAQMRQPGPEGPGPREEPEKPKTERDECQRPTKGDKPPARGLGRGRGREDGGYER